MSDDETLDVLLDDAEAVLGDVKEYIDRAMAIDALRRPQGRRVGKERLETCRKLAPAILELRAALLAIAEPEPEVSNPMREALKAEYDRFRGNQ